jgi:hypothetical protein
MQRDDEVYVGHMLDLSRKVAAKIAGVRREKFNEDENLRLALAHLLQTIGELCELADRLRRPGEVQGEPDDLRSADLRQVALVGARRVLMDRKNPRAAAALEYLRAQAKS